MPKAEQIASEKRLKIDKFIDMVITSQTFTTSIARKRMAFKLRLILMKLTLEDIDVLSISIMSALQNA